MIILIAWLDWVDEILDLLKWIIRKLTNRSNRSG